MSEAEIEVPGRWEASTPLFNWQLEVERLGRAARAAMARCQGDEWILAECECTLDLIAAEVVAAGAHGHDGSYSAVDTVKQLKAWHAQLERLIEQLKSLPS